MKIAICGIVKNEGKYIKEWIAYHNLIGFDQFILFDNESSDETIQALEEAREAGVCVFETVKTTESNKPQLEAYKRGLNLAKKLDVDWILYLDADEFFCLKKHNTIHEFIAEYSAVDAVGINWKMFGDSGFSSFTDELVTKKFTKASLVDFGPNHLIKTIARVDKIEMPHIHTHKLIHGATFTNTELQDLKHFPSARQDLVTHDVAQINHYFTKTKEEWEIKRLRGKADFKINQENRIRDEGEFSFNNKNDCEDLHIQGKLKNLEARISELFRKA